MAFKCEFHSNGQSMVEYTIALAFLSMAVLLPFIPVNSNMGLLGMPAAQGSEEGETVPAWRALANAIIQHQRGYSYAVSLVDLPENPTELTVNAAEYTQAIGPLTDTLISRAEEARGYMDRIGEVSNFGPDPDEEDSDFVEYDDELFSNQTISVEGYRERAEQGVGDYGSSLGDLEHYIGQY